MATLRVADLQPAGSSLFNGSDSFIGCVNELSESELKKVMGGGSKSKKKKGNVIIVYNIYYNTNGGDVFAPITTIVT